MTSQAQRKGPPVSSHLPKPPRTKGKLPEFLTPGEVKLILEAGFKWPLGRMLTRRNRLLARTMYQCGLRVAEAVLRGVYFVCPGCDNKAYSKGDTGVSMAVEE